MTFENLTYWPTFLIIEIGPPKRGHIVGQVSPNISNDFWPYDLLTYFLKFEDIVTKLIHKLEDVICNDFWNFDLLTYSHQAWPKGSRGQPQYC
jgi:hypothetical protein